MSLTDAWEKITRGCAEIISENELRAKLAKGKPLHIKLGVDPTPNLVTTSGSGYDPDISPADADVQVPMVARATGIAPARLRALIASQTNGEQLGFLGSSYINVLQLNEGLAKLK